MKMSTEIQGLDGKEGQDERSCEGHDDRLVEDAHESEDHQDGKVESLVTVDSGDNNTGAKEDILSSASVQHDWYSNYLSSLYYNSSYYMAQTTEFSYPHSHYTGVPSTGYSSSWQISSNPTKEISYNCESAKNVGYSETEPLSNRVDDESQGCLIPYMHYSEEITNNLLQTPGIQSAPITSSRSNQRFIDYTVYGSFNRLTGKFQRVNTASDPATPTVDYGVQERPDIAHRYFDYDGYIEQQGLIRSSAKPHNNRRFTRDQIETLKKRKRERKNKKLRAAYLED